MKFTIDGPPRTKKNSSRILVNRRTGARFVAPSAAAVGWCRDAAIELLRTRRAAGWTAPLATPQNLAALIYRNRNSGDLDNFLAAICDALQAAGIVANDRLIRGHDGSRLLLDYRRPRVEITLTPLEGLS